MLKKIYFFLIILLTTFPAFSIDYITSPLISGVYQDVAVKNNTAYFANEWSITIFDVTDKTDPIVASIIPFSGAFYVGIQNDFLFASTLVSSFGTYEDKTSIYDLTNSQEPILNSEIEESAKRFVIRDTILFLQTQEFMGDDLLFKLKIFDISDIAFPSQIAELDSVKSFDFFNNYLYTLNTNYNESEIHLKIFNADDILNISFLNEIELPLQYSSNNDPYLLIDENIVYIGEWNSLYILSIVNPEVPEISSYTTYSPLMDWINKFTKYEDNLYLTGGKIIDVSNPENPFIAGNYSTAWPPSNCITSVLIDDEYLYVTNWEFGFYLMDLLDPVNPLLTYWYENWDFYSAIYKMDNYAYVTSMQGITILDITMPEDSYVTGSYPYVEWCEDVIVDNNWAYVACDFGLVIFDVSNPEDPYPVSDYQGFLSRLFKKDDFIFTIDKIWGVVSVFNVENINNIQLWGTYDFAENPNALCSKDSLLFIADANEHNIYVNYNGGLRIIDISEPDNLELIATINPDSMRYFRSVAIKDNYVFLGSNEPGIYVFDVSNPIQPIQINYIESGRNSVDMEIENDYLFNGIQIFDISDINNIVLIDSGTSACGPGVAWSIAVDGNYIYEAATYSVNIYHSALIVESFEYEIIPKNSFHIKNYPNPFNPETTISFTTEHTESTEIIIYNIKGQKMKTFPIPNPSLLIPNHVVWDGKDENNQPVGSGIYLYKLKTGNFEKTKKMILIK